MKFMMEAQFVRLTTELDQPHMMIESDRITVHFLEATTFKVIEHVSRCYFIVKFIEDKYKSI